MFVSMSYWRSTPENYTIFIRCLKFLCCNLKDEAARLRMISNKEARAAKRAAQAEKRRQEVEKRRREREEQLKREKEEFERQQNLKAELEEERKRAEEARRYICLKIIHVLYFQIDKY